MTPVHRPGTTSSRRPGARQLMMLVLAIGLLVSACAAVERRPMRLSPTSTAEPGIRVLVDNCPGPSSLTLSVRDEVVWSIERPPTPDDGEVLEAENSGEGTAGQQDPGLIEFIVGQTPPGWTETVPLEAGLRGDTRYTMTSRPDDLPIDFSLGDLAPGLLFDGVGRSQFNQDLITAPCEQPADAGAFVRNLFVVTRRFARIRSVEQNRSADTQPRTRETT